MSKSSTTVQHLNQLSETDPPKHVSRFDINWPLLSLLTQTRGLAVQFLKVQFLKVQFHKILFRVQSPKAGSAAEPGFTLCSNIPRLIALVQHDGGGDQGGHEKDSADRKHCERTRWHADALVRAGDGDGGEEVAGGGGAVAEVLGEDGLTVLHVQGLQTGDHIHRGDLVGVTLSTTAAMEYIGWVKRERYGF